LHRESSRAASRRTPPHARSPNRQRTDRRRTRRPASPECRQRSGAGGWPCIRGRRRREPPGRVRSVEQRAGSVDSALRRGTSPAPQGQKGGQGRLRGLARAACLWPLPVRCLDGDGFGVAAFPATRCPGGTRGVRRTPGTDPHDRPRPAARAAARPHSRSQRRGRISPRRDVVSAPARQRSAGDQRSHRPELASRPSLARRRRPGAQAHLDHTLLTRGDRWCAPDVHRWSGAARG